MASAFWYSRFPEFWNVRLYSSKDNDRVRLLVVDAAVSWYIGQYGFFFNELLKNAHQFTNQGQSIFGFKKVVMSIKAYS